jgi:hypothetical protein
MPTEVGTQTICSMHNVESVWIPACAGMTVGEGWGGSNDKLH